MPLKLSQALNYRRNLKIAISISWAILLIIKKGRFLEKIDVFLDARMERMKQMIMNLKASALIILNLKKCAP